GLGGGAGGWWGGDEEFCGLKVIGADVGGEVLGEVEGILRAFAEISAADAHAEVIPSGFEDVFAVRRALHPAIDDGLGELLVGAVFDGLAGFLVEVLLGAVGKFADDECVDALVHGGEYGDVFCAGGFQIELSVAFFGGGVFF